MKDYVLKFIYWILAGYARKVIKVHKPFVIGITGSAGKSSTKEAVYQVLHDHFGDEVRKNYGNLNAEIGIPLTILGYDKLPNKYFWPCFLFLAYFRTLVKKYPKYLVLEMGVEHKGDIKYFASIARPNIAVITTISPVHVINFKDLNELADEKLSIISELAPNGHVIVNFDDQILREKTGENVISISLNERAADYSVSGIVVSTEGTEYRIESTGQKIAVKTKLIGKQFIYSQLVAFVIGRFFSIQFMDIKNSLAKLEPIRGRMSIVPGKKQSIILDDTYNANPVSVKAALCVLSEIKSGGRKVAIIGNMNELGQYSVKMHEEIGDFARDKCDLAIFVGPNAKIMASGFNDDKRSLTFSNRQELMLKVQELIAKGDIILVKASQGGNFLEEVVKVLMRNPSEAGKLLVRQDKFWKSRKN